MISQARLSLLFTFARMQKGHRIIMRAWEEGEPGDKASTHRGREGNWNDLIAVLSVRVWCMCCGSVWLIVIVELLLWGSLRSC